MYERPGLHSEALAQVNRGTVVMIDMQREGHWALCQLQDNTVGYALKVNVRIKQRSRSPKSRSPKRKSMARILKPGAADDSQVRIHSEPEEEAVPLKVVTTLAIDGGSRAEFKLEDGTDKRMVEYERKMRANRERRFLFDKYD